MGLPLSQPAADSSPLRRGAGAGCRFKLVAHFLCGRLRPQNMGFLRAKPLSGWVAREGRAFPGPPEAPSVLPHKKPRTLRFGAIVAFRRFD